MTPSNARRHAPTVGVLLLLIVSSTRARADGAHDAATGLLALDLSYAIAASSDIPESQESNLNRVGFFLGATTKTDGDTEFAIGADYERRFSDLLGAGLVVEWEPSFEDRVLVAPALFVHPVGELLITVAPGAQFERSSTHFVFRLGAAWDFELAHGLALAPTINYDFVEGAHDAISYGLVLNFSF